MLLSKYLHNLLLGNIDCREILSLIYFKINFLNTRNSDLFYSIPYKMNCMINSSFNILKAEGNSITFDFYYHVSSFIVIIDLIILFVYMCNLTIVLCILVSIFVLLCHLAVYEIRILCIIITVLAFILL